jgi:hypothetical protein
MKMERRILSQREGANDQKKYRELGRRRTSHRRGSVAIATKMNEDSFANGPLAESVKERRVNKLICIDRTRRAE